MPITKLKEEQSSLQPLPPVYSVGAKVVVEQNIKLSLPIESLQHPLSVYQQILEAL
jgi:hypothetical protein